MFTENKIKILSGKEISQVAGGNGTSNLKNVRPISCNLADSPASVNKENGGNGFINVHVVYAAAA